MNCLLAALKVSGKSSGTVIVLLLASAYVLFAWGLWHSSFISSSKATLTKITRVAVLMTCLALGLVLFALWLWPTNAEVASRCPRPLEFSLRAISVVPSPTADNYATEITIRSNREPMYHVHVFTRSVFSSLNLIKAPEQGLSTTETRPWMPKSFFITSTHPAKEYKVIVSTSEALRVVCVNQDN